MLQYFIALEVHKNCCTFKWWFLSIISFRTRSSHVPGIPFCPFSPSDPFCPTDPFSPSMKKQTYKKRLYSTDLRGRSFFAIHHEITLRSYCFSSLSLSCVRRKNFFYKPHETFFRRSRPPPPNWIITNPYQVLPGVPSPTIIAFVCQFLVEPNDS